MKSIVLLFSVLVFFSCTNEVKEKVSSDSILPEGNYSIDVKNSKLMWVGKKPTGEHTGEILFSKGEFEILDNKIKKGELELNMNSISCTDLQGEDSLDLVGHLKGKDFFNVDSCKTASIQIISSELDSLNFKIKANLIIKGISNQVEFISGIKFLNDSIIVLANFEIDRTLWGIKYKSKKIYQLADKFINDNVAIRISIKAKKKE